MSLHHLTELITSLSDIVSQLIQIGVYVIAICSLISSATPPPLPKDDPDNSRFGRIRKTWIYKWWCKLLSFGASNIGWAKNFTSPKVMAIVKNVFLATVNKGALNNLAQEADEAVEEKKKAQQEDPTVVKTVQKRVDQALDTTTKK